MKKRKEMHDGAEPAAKRKKLKSGKRSADVDGGLQNMDMDQFLAGGFVEAVPEAKDHWKGSIKPQGTAKKAKKVQTLEAKNKQTKAGRQALREPSKAEKIKEVQPKPVRAQEGKKAQQRKQKGEKSAAKEHKNHLDALKTKDPEFYEYLQATDKDLLDFEYPGTSSDDDKEGDKGGSSEDDSIPSDSESEPEVVQEERTEKQKKKTKVEERSSQEVSVSQSTSEILTQDLVEQWCKDAKDHRSIAAVEKLIKAYRIACHLGDEEDDMSATMRITSSTVFNKVLDFVLKEAGGLLRKAAGLPEGRLTVDAIKRAKRWHKTENIIKSFLGNSLHLLGQMTDEAMIEFMLKHLRPSVPFLVSSERTQRKFMKQVLQIFGEGGQKARIQAFLFIREMAISIPNPNLSLAMKGVYRQFVLNAKFMSPGTLPNINFMANCLVDLYGLDMGLSYEITFEYLRQLAIIIRGGVSQKTKEAYKEVYCWQTISSLELWAKVISTHASKEELRPLVHPITQLLIATVRLVPTPRYYPLRLRCVRALNKISQATKLYVPVAPLLVESLHWGKLYKAAKPGGKRASSVPQLRASKQDLEGTSFQQSYVEEVFLLLAEHLAQWSTSVAFPEMSFITSYQLAQLAKTCKMDKMKGGVKGLNAAILANSEVVARERKKLDCSPKDTAVLDQFMASEAEQARAPMRKYAISLREKWERQQSLAATDSVQVAKENPTDEHEGLPYEDLMPRLQKDAKLKKENKKSAPKVSEVPSLQGQKAEEDLDGIEDDIKDFEFSDSDEEEE